MLYIGMGANFHHTYNLGLSGPDRATSRCIIRGMLWYVEYIRVLYKSDHYSIIPVLYSYVLYTVRAVEASERAKGEKETRLRVPRPSRIYKMTDS